MPFTKTKKTAEKITNLKDVKIDALQKELAATKDALKHEKLNRIITKCPHCGYASFKTPVTIAEIKGKAQHTCPACTKDIKKALNAYG